MIQSMEILQLPIMALQERIEQEMNENPLLEMQEVDPDVAGREQERDNPDAPADTERESWSWTRRRTTRTISSGCLNMDSEFPTHFDDGPRPSATRMEEEADRKHDAMANVASRPESLQRLSDASARRNWSRPTGGDGERIISTLEPRPTATCGPAWRTCCRPTPPTSWPGPAALEVVQGSTRPAWAPRSARVPAAAADARHAVLRRGEDAHHGHLEDLRDNRLPQISARPATRSSDPGRLGAAAKLNPKPGADFSRRSCRPSRPTCSSSRTTTATTRCGWRTADAHAVHQRLLPPAA
jgi:RNA polymerase sigma-54 factor